VFIVSYMVDYVACSFPVVAVLEAWTVDTVCSQ